MTEEKKDITGVLEYSKKINDTKPTGLDSEPHPTENSFAENHSNLLEPSNDLSLDIFSDTPSNNPNGDPGEHSVGMTSEELPSGNPDFETLTDHLIENPTEEFDQGLNPSQDSPDIHLDKVKNYSETIPIGKPVVQPRYPFNLSITGQLSLTEKEKLLDLLARHSMGISEEELKIQFEQDRILLPRISEYAGVLLVQALRGSKAIFRLFPTEAPALENEAIPVNSNTFESPEISEHPAETLPLTQGLTLAQISNPLPMDTLMATATLKAQIVEATHSAEYQEILEALKRELKYKAFRKGARGIVGFSISLTPLSSPTHYRLTASGTAVK